MTFRKNENNSTRNRTQNAHSGFHQLIRIAIFVLQINFYNCNIRNIIDAS
jgi:hypothetical protein